MSWSEPALVDILSEANSSSLETQTTTSLASQRHSESNLTPTRPAHVETGVLSQSAGDALNEICIRWAGKTPRAQRHRFLEPEEWDDHVKLDHHQPQSCGIRLRPNMDVELLGSVFLRIYQIGMDRDTHKVFVRGLVFLRNGQPWTDDARRILAYQDADMADYLPEGANELHASINIVCDSPFDPMEQALRIFPAEVVLRIRQLRVTNRLFPMHNPAFEEGGTPDQESSSDVLVCRWVTTKLWQSKKSLDSFTISHCCRRVAMVSASELVKPDVQFAAPHSSLLYAFRGLTKKGGSSYGIDSREVKRRQYERTQAQRAEQLVYEELRGNPVRAQDNSCVSKTSTSTIPLYEEAGNVSVSDSGAIIRDGTAETDPIWKRTIEMFDARTANHVRRYSFADIFCGCGGASMAAVFTGLDVQYAVDIEANMCETFQLNHPSARVAWTDAKTFVSCYVLDMRVDILHLSFPCQPFSKAHTTKGRDDDLNRGALATLEAYVERAQPRIVTIEEADGLGIYEKHRLELKRIILQLTLLKYSVEFKIVRFADYGICQKRSRLVVIASCPGQRLPGFPEPTHIDPVVRGKLLQQNSRYIDNLERPSWIGPQVAITSLPSKWPRHNPADETLLVQDGRDTSPNHLVSTIITKNGHLAHWEGWRKYTLMEKVLIQGFPIYFEFPEYQRRKAVEKQIGNAVPPKGFAVILKHIQKELLRDDGKLDELDMDTGERRPVVAALDTTP